MRERHWREGERIVRGRRDLVPRHVCIDGKVTVWHADRLPDRRQPRTDRSDVGRLVDRFVTETIATDNQQDVGIELTEAVENCPGSELGSTAGPDRSEARGRKERHHGLGDVGKVRHDPIARSDTESVQPRPHPPDLLGKVAEAQRDVLARL